MGAGYRYDRSCPVHLLYSLSSAVSSLYRYGSYGNPAVAGTYYSGRGRFEQAAAMPTMGVGPGAAYTLNANNVMQPSVGPSFAGQAAFGSAPMIGFQATTTTGTTATTNPFNPTCPWVLINGMIQQIVQYVNQMQSAQGGGPTATNLVRNSAFAASPFARGPAVGRMRK